MAGGGVAAVETLLALRAAPRGGELEVTLLAPGAQLDYRPISVLEPFGGAPRRRYPLDRICAEHDATLVADALAAVDGERRVVTLAGGGELPYDALVVAVGARREPALPDALTYLARDDEMQWIVRELEQRDVRTVAFAVPPESGWSLPLYELALLTAHHAAARGIGDIALTLVTHEPEPLAVVGGDASRAVGRLLGRADVHVVTGRRVVGWERRTVALDPPDGEGPLVVDRLVALPRLRGPEIDGLPCDEHGFIEVDDHMRVARPGGRLRRRRRDHLPDQAGRPRLPAGRPRRRADRPRRRSRRQPLGAAARDPADRRAAALHPGADRGRPAEGLRRLRDAAVGAGAEGRGALPVAVPGELRHARLTCRAPRGARRPAPLSRRSSGSSCRRGRPRSARRLSRRRIRRPARSARRSRA